MIEFEGEEISEYVAAIPPMKLEAPESYQRGTYLTLQVEVRVRSVRYEEVASGKKKGELQKVHIMAPEDVKVVSVLTPQQRHAALVKMETAVQEPTVNEPEPEQAAAELVPAPDEVEADLDPGNVDVAPYEFKIPVGADSF